ncbi:polysaccharide deacetylase family protein [Fontivita pretiosa]|uniref:polysaccharide deacetylase family protein n=1 Tax=Fontivita pretiosa TaxID=2989684 RepID=UPI003D187589
MRHAPSHWTDLLRSKPWTVVQGGVVRGDVSLDRLSLIFTGGEYGEGARHILDVLARQNLKASFFVTGEFLRKPEHQDALKRMIADGHYLGPHSDWHPLYCAWEDRSKTLVTEAFFKSDLQKNIADLRSLGALPDASEVVYFIPPYEWYNADQSRWAGAMNVLLFNFTPGTGSNRDWAPEGHRSYVPAQRIIEDILAYERDRTKDPHGLNGFLLLLHLGSQRQDKTWKLLEPLIEELKRRGYSFARVDELLAL